jgi:predicted metal-dependent peptidase
MNKLQQAISALLFTEPFYGNLISKMRINKSKEVPSAGVYITDKINLIYNEEWLFNLDVIDIAKVLKHECGHILQEHIPRAKQIGAVSKEMHKRFNLATDATINIADLKKMTEKIGGVTVKSLNEMMQGMIDKANAKDNGKRLFSAMQDGQIAEYYYNRINQFADENPDLCEKGEAGDFGETTDDHSTWDKSDGNEEMMKEVAKDAVNNAVKSAGGIGNVPGDVAALVNEMNKSQVNWKQQLRQACVSAQKSLRQATRKRRNRRYGILQPGVKKKPKLKVVVPVDTSGSMMGEPLKHAWAELAAMYASSQELELIVVEADCVVHNVYEFDPKKTPEFRGAGGTSYGPALAKAKELKADLIVYVGDMDAADKPEDPRIPVIWCVTGTSKPPGDFGKTIYVEVGK